MVPDKVIYTVFIIVLSCLITGTIIIASSPKIKDDPLTIENGDCVMVSYIGMYANNYSIFASSYTDPINMTNDTKFPAFISLYDNQTSWHKKFSKIIYGLSEGLIGMREGESKTIGPIPPEKGFYDRPKPGDNFTSSIVTVGSFSQDFEILSVHKTLDVWWKNVGNIGDSTLPPKYVYDVSRPPSYGFDITGLITFNPPFDLFVNASEIINVTEDAVIYRLKENPLINLSQEQSILDLRYGIYQDEHAYLFYGTTNVSLTNDSFTLHIDPPVMKQIFLPNDEDLVLLSLVNVTNDTINVSLESFAENSTITYLEYPRSFIYNRNVEIPRYYSIDSSYFDDVNQDLAEHKLSLSPYAGETLIYNVTVHQIYKNPQQS